MCVVFWFFVVVEVGFFGGEGEVFFGECFLS